MKTHIKNLFLLPALIAGLGLIPAGRVTAQTFTTLHSFTGGSGGANSQSDLIISANTLYGTAVSGGSSDVGLVFAVNTDGTGFTNLHNFTGSDGANPYGGLVLSGNTLYGTASIGGSSGNGTVFKVNTDGTGFTNLHSFTTGSPAYPFGPLTNSDGITPYAGLILSGNTLYGTAFNGGSAAVGTVFAINTDGTGFTNLHSFTGGEGYNPYARLILSDNTLYGTTVNGGAGAGTVFAVNTDGTGFTNLYNFTGGGSAFPYGGLILSSNTLYGTTRAFYYVFIQDQFYHSAIFAVKTDGSDFTNLYSFTGGLYSGGSDGSHVNGGLILSGNTLYGMATYGGISEGGTVFGINTDGTGFTNLHSFISGSDGANPYAGLILSDSTLYGTVRNGGSSNNGTVFALVFPPTITNHPQNQYVFPGENATFTVLAGGGLPLSYQWRFNGTNLVSATDSGFTRSNVQSNHFGNYDVVVTNFAGSITSAVATLGYVLKPVLTNQYLSGGTFTFTLNGNSPARNYLIQQSTNLPSWSNVLTFSNISGPVMFTETNADVFFKVFRAKIVP